jgi:hypothetical protein
MGVGEGWGRGGGGVGEGWGRGGGGAGRGIRLKYGVLVGEMPRRNLNKDRELRMEGQDWRTGPVRGGCLWEG